MIGKRLLCVGARCRCAWCGKPGRNWPPTPEALRRWGQTNARHAAPGASGERGAAVGQGTQSGTRVPIEREEESCG